MKPADFELITVSPNSLLYYWSLSEFGDTVINSKSAGFIKLTQNIAGKAQNLL